MSLNINDIVTDGSAKFKVVKNATTEDIYNGQDVFKRELGFRQKNTIYQVDDVAYNETLPTGYYLSCVTAGTTSNTNLIISDIDNNVTDGSVIWKILKISESQIYENNFTIIYPNNGTEENPADVTINSRYVETNPFPGYYVKCEAEVLIDNQWGISGFAFSNGTGGYGTMASQLDDSDIVIQTGGAAVATNSNNCGAPFPNFNTSITSAPCRVKVWKIGKIPT